MTDNQQADYDNAYDEKDALADFLTDPELTIEDISALLTDGQGTNSLPQDN